MTQALQHQPLANLKAVTRCTASYIKELEEVREVLKDAKAIIRIIYDGDYGSQISDDLFNVLQKLEEA